MPNYKRFIFWDIKRENDNIENDIIIHDPAVLKHEITKNNRILYQPDNPEPEDFNDVCEVVFHSGLQNTIYVDEAAYVSKTNTIEYWHKIIMTQGRAKGIGIINVSQRPHDIHNTLISEAEHMIVFKLTLQTDLNKIESTIGTDAAEEVKVLPYHYFLYYNERDNILRLFKPIYQTKGETPKLEQFKPTLKEYLALIERK